MEKDVVGFGVLHELIIPEESLPPFAIKFYFSGWEPGYPTYDKRDYFIVHEVAKMLKKRKIIRRDVTGIQQTRKWLRDNRIPGSKLYKNSKKYGYLIPKRSFAKFYEEMTADSFVEVKFVDCLLGAQQNEWFFEMKEEEFQAKIHSNNEKIKSGKLSGVEKEKLQRQNRLYQEKIDTYRILWYQAIFE